MRAAVLRSDRNNRKSIGIPDGEISPIYLGATTKTEMGAQGMYIYGMSNRDSVRSQGPMTNRKYVLGPGSDLADIPLHIWSAVLQGLKKIDHSCLHLAVYVHAHSRWSATAIAPTPAACSCCRNFTPHISSTPPSVLVHTFVRASPRYLVMLVGPFGLCSCSFCAH